MHLVSGHFFPTVVEPGKPAWREVVRQFGDSVLKEDGSINRAKLSSLIFSDEGKRQTLNRCTHPYIRRAVLWEIAKNFIKGMELYLIAYLYSVGLPL